MFPGSGAHGLISISGNTPVYEKQGNGNEGRTNASRTIHAVSERFREIMHETAFFTFYIAEPDRLCGEFSFFLHDSGEVLDK